MRRGALRVLAVTAALACGRARVASACGWDSESYHAEAKSLPCVFNALTGIYPSHTATYYETRAAAAAAALAWAPGYGPALDDEGLALMKLGRFVEARVVMERRAQAAPDAYAAHANLGTLTTFTGDYALALAHIDRAMTLEPGAHFGREIYHRRLVVYLKALAADPGVIDKDLLGLALTKEQRLDGSPAKLAAAGVSPDAFDALVSMITVYGAERVSHVYFALGDVLALRGDLRLAWTAYEDARALGHPRAQELRRWMTELQAKITEKHFRTNPPRRPDQPGGYKGMERSLGGAHAVSLQLSSNYDAWEQHQLAKGLPVWREEGLAVIYAKQHELRRRCEAPGVIDDRPADPRVDEAAARAAASKVAAPRATPDPKGEVYVTALEAAAALSAPAVTCKARPAAEATFRAAHADALAISSTLFEVLSTAQRTRFTRALDAIVDATMACRRAAR